MADADADGDSDLWAHLLGRDDSPMNRVLLLILTVVFALFCLHLLIVFVGFQDSKSVTCLHCGSGSSQENYSGEVKMLVWKSRTKDD